MTVSSRLTSELRTQVLQLEGDLRERLAAQPEVDARWRAEHAAAVKAERTATSWQEWSADRVTQAAVAWILTTVFLRFCEDNSLLEQVWISGPEHRRQEALDRQAHFLQRRARETGDATVRDWLLDAVSHLQELPATAALVDETSPLWQVTPSGDKAEELVTFWRHRRAQQGHESEFDSPEWNTRFLGDLYQDLSEAARDKYALLQTPDFVEKFILDLTLAPALRERQLDGFKLIDPTCGSGHFLLGGFQRLLDKWQQDAPGLDQRERVQKALDSVYGVDLNPFAVAIARFRLTIAALKASGMQSLEGAPAFKYHLAVGDSLRYGRSQEAFNFGAQFAEDPVAAGLAYATENYEALRSILTEGQYDVVVGNPPYITVKDKAANKAYRGLYNYCKGTYALTVPFLEKFFDLAKDGRDAGWVGQITSNSFMKREFGGPLIEKFFPRRDLQHVIDTSGAYIPGHGTPTLVIAGQNRAPVASTVRAVLGIRGEPGRPANAAKGLVWSSIVEHVQEPGWSDEWVSVTELHRERLATHPWSLTGGGADELSAALDRARHQKLDALVTEIGFGAVTREDAAFMVGDGTLRRAEIPLTMRRPLVEGDVLRDWNLSNPVCSLWPYDEGSLEFLAHPAVSNFLWPWRTQLSERVAYGLTQIERGLNWAEYSMFFHKRYRRPLSITFAFVATHNHFVLDRGGKVFNRSAPVIKLPEGATEDDHLALLGVLNSSTACFWLKQNSHNKGSTVDSAGARQTLVAWENFYEFTGTTLKDYPLPSGSASTAGRVLHDLAQQLAAATPSAVAAAGAPTRAVLDDAHVRHSAIRQRMVASQEELDWQVYSLYDLVDEPLTYGKETPPLALGERAFEVVLARRAAAGEESPAWFARHGSMAITELPAQWPADYRQLVDRRIELVQSHPYLRLLEKPEHKRRWAAESWEKQEQEALRGWLLDRLEDKKLWLDRHGRPTTRSVAQLADDVSRDEELASVLALWEGRPDVPAAASLQRLLSTEAVPFLAAYRYKDTGLRKREAWEQTWALQRSEDAGEKLAEPIPVPPKYTNADFRRVEYWSHRGKLDVPKERFILYPDVGRPGDPTPLLGWAGWDHAQQALALLGIIQQRQNEGMAEDRLKPLIAGLVELQPWLDQWHNEPDPSLGGVVVADYARQKLDDLAREVGMTPEQLTAWRPEPPKRGRAAGTATRAAKKTATASTKDTP